MDPERSAFFSAVFRFLTLHFDPKRPWNREYEALSDWLRETRRDDGRLEWQERSFRRIPMEGVRATVWNHGVGLQGELVDLCATGLMLRGLPRRANLEDGRRTAVSITPPGSTLRVDLPCEVIRSPAEGELCVQFRGLPLVIHKRAVPRKRRSTQARMAQVAANRNPHLQLIDDQGRAQNVPVVPAAVEVEPGNPKAA